jgi:hypothetical protein
MTLFMFEKIKIQPSRVLFMNYSSYMSEIIKKTRI